MYVCNMHTSKEQMYIHKYANFLWNDVKCDVEMDPRGPKNGQSKICPFLYSNGHTEAEKIPENFFPWYHLACFFEMKIFKKIFLA